MELLASPSLFFAFWREQRLEICSPAVSLCLLSLPAAN